jgi:hypothetical protein
MSSAARGKKRLFRALDAMHAGDDGARKHLHDNAAGFGESPVANLLLSERPGINPDFCNALMAGIRTKCKQL